MIDVCIVGGGLAGATAASVLVDVELTVYEANDGPVWLFDPAGEVSPETSEQSTRWCGAAGLDPIPRAMFQHADATVHEETTVNQLSRTDDGWEVTADGDHESFDALVLAVPAGSASVLLRRAEWDEPADAAEAAADRAADLLNDDLAVAGDWTQGIGRTRAAARSGLLAGEGLADRL